MAALDTREQTIEFIINCYNNARTAGNAAYSQSLEAAGHNQYSQYKDAIYHLINAISYLNTAVTSSTAANYEYPVYPLYAVPYYVEHFTLYNYVDICNAWAKDGFRGRAETIAYIDRMRQLIWNEPFNAIWAARPEGG